MKRKSSFLQTSIQWLLKLAVLGILAVLALFIVLTVWPSVGAKGSDLLRNVIGDAAVAKLETVFFNFNDQLQTLKYNSGLAKPAVPWSVPVSPPTLSNPSNAGTLEDTSSGASSAVSWSLKPLTPLGGQNGEGIWSPYIQDASGEVVAQRTFLQPDPKKAYAIVAVVAFDLTRTRLHFVLGSDEPYAPNAPKRSGEMPQADKAHGVLVAMFNGGFKGRHGHFGAMADGIVALPPRNGLGTLAIYKDGKIALGEWGKDIAPSADILAWRQNGPLVIQKGQINPKVDDNSPQDWGYTVDSVAPTWRSGIGLSPDGKVLYYFCGPGLSMGMLAQAMQATGVESAIQLDINTFWVHFVAVQPDGKLEALFPDMMKEDIGRYLFPYTRDFFYVTKAP